MDSSITQFLSRHGPAALGRALIVGSSLKPGRQDRRKLYKNALGLDFEDGDGVDLVHDLTTPMGVEFEGSFAHAECTSVMEHCNKPWLMATNLEAVLQIGGTLLLSVPFVWRQHAYPSDYFRFTAEGVRELFPRIEWTALLYVGAEASESPRNALRGFRKDGHPYFARTEVYGFGVRV